ncbi:Hypothetical predicted protein [Cloeon dipterum]|uniref:BTB domain-containing protein n=1 Tax=Cloeon dipterum TaxID=197152 RepID=A0A8S1DJC9_9INSE|nr:Hypothetical predicted protein [Cloeon dipterum]
MNGFMPVNSDDEDVKPCNPEITVKFGSGWPHRREVVAHKLRLMACSPYIKELIDKNPEGPITIDDVQPEIFDVLLHFIAHMRFEYANFLNLRYYIMLADAAVKLQVLSLGEACAEAIGGKLTDKNIWDIYGEYSDIKFIAETCEKVLAKNTEKYLQLPGFLEIKPEALSKFLTLDKMEIDSEMTLILASINYADAQKNPREVFRKYALPHLRLLSLKLIELPLKLQEWLTDEERIFISEKLFCRKPLLQYKDVPELKNSLCGIEEGRKPGHVHTLIILKEKRILGLVKQFLLSNFFLIPSCEEHLFSMKFKAKKCLLIKQLEVFCPLHLDSEDIVSNDPIAKLKRNEQEFATFSDGYKMLATVRVQGDLDEKMENYFGPVDEQSFLNRWTTFKLGVLVRKDRAVTVEVRVCGKWTMRLIERSAGQILKTSSSSSVKEALGEFKIEHKYSVNGGDFKAFKASDTKNLISTIFKSMDFITY